MPKQTKGFTLVEVLLYLAVVGSILLAVCLFLSLLLTARVKNQTMTEVEQQGEFVMRTIMSAVQNAESLNLPAPGSSGSELSLSSYTGQNPVVFSQNAGAVEISEGGSIPVSLTAPNVAVSNLSFTNLPAAGPGGSIRAQFTLTFNSQSSAQEYVYSQVFENAATLRK